MHVRACHEAWRGWRRRTVMSLGGLWAPGTLLQGSPLLKRPLRLRPRAKGLPRSRRGEQTESWVCLPQSHAPPTEPHHVHIRHGPLPACLGVRVQRPRLCHTGSLIMGKVHNGYFMVFRVFTICGYPARWHVACPPQTGLAVAQGLSPLPLFSLSTAPLYPLPSLPANPLQLLQSSS